MSAVELLTFGCRLNAAESETMRRNAAAQGAQDTVIVNTCAVTAEAVRQAQQAIRRARRDRPEAQILVTGCAAQIDPGRFAAMPEVSRVIGNSHKLAPDFADLGTRRVAVGDIMAEGYDAVIGVPNPSAPSLRARAFVPIQNGCDHRCTFCIIPFGRGPSRSVPAGTVVDTIRAFLEAGTAEIVLTGVDLTAYGADLPGQPTLGSLVERILRLVPDLKRLRLSSIDSIEADETLVRLLSEHPRLLPHVHLSLQSGDDMILKRMKRRHSRADAIAFCAMLKRRRPEIAFGADLIAGFPTETDAMFENTRALIDACGLTYTHVFPYSPRPGTPAARMPQLPRDIVRARAKALRAEGADALAAALARQVGTATSALAEKPLEARTDSYAPIMLDRAAHPGEVVRVRITGATPTHLQGTLA